MGRDEEELVANQRALAKRSDPRTLGNQALTFGSLGRLDEQLAMWQRATDEHPEHARGWYGRGMALRLRREIEAALRCFERASRLEGTDDGGAMSPETWANLGYMQQLAGDLQGGTRSLGRAIELYRERCREGPEDADIRYWTAATLALLGDRDATLTELAHAVRLDPALAAEAKSELDFKRFWEDPEFARLTGAVPT